MLQDAPDPNDHHWNGEVLPACIEEFVWEGWADDPELMTLPVGSTVPVKGTGSKKNPRHDLYTQGMLVAVLPNGSAQLLMDLKSVSEQLYKGRW